MPDTAQASASLPPSTPIGFEKFYLPVRSNRPVDLSKGQLNRQARNVKSAKSIRRHST
jgi:hypothetical protein